MRQKIIAGALLFVALLLTGMGYLIAYRPDLLNICPLPYSYENGHCLDLNALGGIVFPLIELKYILPLFLLVAFIRPDVFKLWLKFAIPFALFALYTILGTSPEGGSGGWIYSSPTRTEVTYFFSLWLLSSSLILFATKTLRPHWRAYFTIPAALTLSFLILLFAGVRTFLI